VQAEPAAIVDCQPAAFGMKRHPAGNDLSCYSLLGTGTMASTKRVAA